MPHEPKKKHSKAQKRTRRASINLKAASNIAACKNCGEKTFSHMACRSCGFYAGKKATERKQSVKVTKA